MGVDPPRGKASAASRRLSVGRLALASVLATAAVLWALYYTAPLYPHITVVVKSPSGSPQPRAYVQVYALLPPGTNKSLALVWNGTTDGQGRAYIPLGRLAPIARKWAEKGFGSSDVGLQIVATYGNATAFFTRFLFVTYKPKDVIEADNPLGGLYYSKTVEVKLKQVRIKAQRGGSRTASPYDVSAPQPPPPPASVCGGLTPIWMEVWEYQTPTTYIPIIWLYDQMGYNAGGYIEGLASSSTTMSFAASVALTPNTQLGSSSISNAEFEFAGTSFSDTISAFNNAPWGYMGFENPTSVALNVRGTLGTAEFQVYCYDPITGYTAPVDYYAVEVYIQSADLSRIYRSTAVGITPVENMLNILSQYGYIGYYPFDYYQVSPGNPYIYSFISIQQNSNWEFSWEIPAGALLIYVLEGIGITLPYSEALAAALIASASFTSTTTAMQAVAFAVQYSSPPYGNVLISYLTIPYQNGESFQPFMVGVVIEPSTSRTVNTTLAISGATILANGACVPSPVNATYYVYTYIDSSPLLVPGGSVDYWLYDSTGQLVAYGSVGVPWHKPAVLTLQLNPGTYNLIVQYDGYSDGPITYLPSNPTQIQISVYPGGC